MGRYACKKRCEWKKELHLFEKAEDRIMWPPTAICDDDLNGNYGFKWAQTFLIFFIMLTEVPDKLHTASLLVSKQTLVLSTSFLKVEFSLITSILSMLLIQIRQ